MTLTEAPWSPPPAEPDGRLGLGPGHMSLVEHLEELRGRLFKIVLAFTAASVAAWFLYDRILGVLVGPLRSIPGTGRIISRGKLVFTAPTEAFFIRVKVVCFAALVLALPVILWQLWRFVTPGLYAREKKFAIPFVLVSVVLFGVGAAFALATLPAAVKLLAGFGGTELVLLPRASEYLSFVLLMVAAFGLTFELPVAVLGLTLAGVLSSSLLRRTRKISWVVILLVAAIVTPTPDPVTMLLLALPLGILFEATILTARLMKR